MSEGGETKDEFITRFINADGLTYHAWEMARSYERRGGPRDVEESATMIRIIRDLCERIADDEYERIFGEDDRIPETEPPQGAEGQSE